MDAVPIWMPGATALLQATDLEACVKEIYKFLFQLCKMLSDINIEIYISGIPVEAANKSSHVAIVVTARGGHIGFMEGMFPTNTYYSDRLYGQLVKGIFSNLEAMKKLKKEADDYARSCNSEAIGSES